MNTTHLNNLLFLLAGSSLALGCDININDSAGSTAGDDGATGGDGAMTSDVDDGMTSVADGMTSDVDDGMTTTPADDGMTSDVDDGTDATTVDDGMTTGVGGDVCVDYAENIVLCELNGKYSVDDYAGFCKAAIEYYTAGGAEGCAEAIDDVFACLSILDCKSLAQATGCEEAAATAAKVCGVDPKKG